MIDDAERVCWREGMLEAPTSDCHARPLALISARGKALGKACGMTFATTIVAEVEGGFIA